MMNLQVVGGKTFKYERKSLEEEMPVFKIKKKYWFLWELVNDQWYFMGGYETKADMIRRMRSNGQLV